MAGRSPACGGSAPAHDLRDHLLKSDVGSRHAGAALGRNPYEIAGKRGGFAAGRADEPAVGKRPPRHHWALAVKPHLLGREASVQRTMAERWANLPGACPRHHHVFVNLPALSGSLGVSAQRRGGRWARRRSRRNQNASNRPMACDAPTMLEKVQTIARSTTPVFRQKRAVGVAVVDGASATDLCIVRELIKPSYGSQRLGERG